MRVTHRCLGSFNKLISRRRTDRGRAMPARWFAALAACVLVVAQAFSLGHYTQAHILGHGSETNVAGAPHHADHALTGEIATATANAAANDVDSPQNSHLIDCDLCGHSLGLAAAVTSTDWYRSFVAVPLVLTYQYQPTSAPLPYSFASSRAPPAHYIV